MISVKSNAEKLVAWTARYPSCLVAFSGGVDSAVVAQAAVKCHRAGAIAVTADSPSLPAGELQAAKDLADKMGIRHLVIQTSELKRASYVANTGDRCYWCKTELYEQIARLPEAGDAVVFNGTNTDDLGDYRPGLISARENQVLSPLVECGLNKTAARELARHWNLDVWNKPAGPCLASRIAPGVEVTPERLRMVDDAECFLRSLGFETVRVRWHEGALARIEVEKERVAQAASLDLAARIQQELGRLGFRHVTIDLDGFRSGSLNSLVPLATLTKVQESIRHPTN